MGVKKTITFILLFISYSTSAKPQEIDFQTTRYQDSILEARAIELMGFGMKAAGTHSDSIVLYGNQARLAIQKIKNDTITMRGYYRLALYYGRYNDKRAYTYLELTRILAEKLDSKSYELRVYIFLAGKAGNNSEYNKAIAFHAKAIKLSKESNDNLGLAISYYNISDSYKATKNDSLAKKFSYLAYQTLKEDKILAKKYVFRVHMMHLKWISFMEDYKEVVVLLESEIAYFKESKNYQWSAIAHYDLAWVQEKELLYEKAIENYKAGIVYDLKHREGSSVGYYYLAFTYEKQQNYTEAKRYLDLFLKGSDLDRTLIKKKVVYKLASTVYAKTKEHKKAITFYQNYVELQDSIISRNRKNAHIEYGKKFETEQKEKEIILYKLRIQEEQAKQTKIIFGTIIGGLVLILVFLALYFRQKKNKQLTEFALKKEQELRTLRTYFLENISHEIRTPITIIMGYLNLIQKHMLSPKKVLSFSNLALQSSKQVISNANEFLTLTKYEKNELQLELSEYALNPFVYNLLYNFKASTEIKQLEFLYTTNINDQLVASLDFDKLEKILNNLITNAIKFSSKGARISFETRVTENQIRFVVKDQGIGIANSELSEIFTRFYQSKNNKQTGGVGVGLSLVKDFVTLLKGTVSVESDIGVGSTFTVQLPTQLLNIDKNPINEELHTIVLNKEAVVESAQINPDFMNILIVEDNVEMIAFLREILSPFFNCSLVFNGKEALEKVNEHSFDLIVSDLRMPEMDGFEFKNALNKMGGYESIPFIMLTANTLKTTKSKSLSIGINDYLVKPFNEKELLVRIENLLVNKAVQIDALKIKLKKEISQSNNYYVALVVKVNEIILKNLDNESFTVKELAVQCNFSERQLSRILITQTGLSPNKLILEIRLLKSYELITTQVYNRLNEVMYSVGIVSDSYFNKCFHKRFGLKPKELMDK